MELHDIIMQKATNTVGYAEAKSKDSFIVGASVAINKSEEHFNKTIEALESQVKAWKSAYEIVYEDIKTMVKIINKYQDQD